MNKFILFLTLAIGLNSFSAHATNDIPPYSDSDAPSKQEPSIGWLMQSFSGLFYLMGLIGISTAFFQSNISSMHRIGDVVGAIVCIGIGQSLRSHAYELCALKQQLNESKSDIAQLRIEMKNNRKIDIN